MASFVLKSQAPMTSGIKIEKLESVYKLLFFILVIPEVCNRVSRTHWKEWIPAQQTAGMTAQLLCLYTDTI